MGQSLLVTAEETVVPPILIVDKEGSIGLGLCAKLQGQTQVVLVSSREPEIKDNVLHLPFLDTFPDIPEEQYSHIFYVVYDEKKEEGVITACIRKAQQDGTFFSLVVEKRKLSKNPASYVPHSLRYGNVMVVGDLFNTPVHKKHAFVIERLFKNARSHHTLRLSNMGLVKLYPVAYHDAIDAILQKAFSSKPKVVVYGVYPGFAVTELGVARAMQKADPALTVDFTGEEEIKNEGATEEAGESVLPQEYPVFELLEKAFHAYTVEEEHHTSIPVSEKEEEETFTTPLPVNPPKIKTKRTRFLSYLGGFLVTLVLLPAIVSLGSLSLGKVFLLSAKNDLLSGKFSQAISAVHASQQSFDLAQTGIDVFSLEAIMPPFTDWALSWREETTSAQSLADGGENILTAALQTESVLQGKSTNPASDMKAAVQLAQSGYSQLQVVENSSLLPQSIKMHLSDALSKMTPVINASELLPSVLGLQGEKTYLVLFQNNSELRPGGGFIGSYGLLTLSNGVVKDFSIHDVYDADGQLKGHVEPPFAIRRYMGVVHLYLRDSNFDVDFSKDAFMAAQMLHLETGQTVDGVVAMDLNVVKNILAGVGSVYVPEYGQTVTADNFFSLAETHAEKNFFPGSTQKKDFLQSVFAALKNKLGAKDVSYEKIAQGILQSTSEKHLLFAFADAGEQDVLTANHLSSTLWDPRPETQINDFLGVNEANIGVNKVNYYVKRHVRQHVQLTDSGDIEGTAVLDLSNESTPDEAYAGAYTSYIRFILPQNAQLTSISIDGQAQTIVPAVTDFLQYEKKNFTPPLGLEVEKTQEEGKMLYGFKIVVPQQGKREIAVSYTIAHAASSSSPTATYSLMLYKQPGTDIYPYSFTFDYPSSYRVVSASEGLQEKQQEVTLSTDLSSDQTFSVYLGKK